MRGPGILWAVVLSVTAVLIFATATGVPACVSDAMHITSAAWDEAFHRDEKAIMHLNQVRSQKHARELAVWRTELWRHHSVSLFLQGKFSEAVAGFKNVYLSGSDAYFVNIIQAICYAKCGQIHTALDILDTAISNFPNRQDAYLIQGHIYLYRGDMLRALCDYFHAVASAGKLGPVYVDIGDAFMGLNHRKSARKWYDAAYQSDPDSPFVLLRQAEVALIMDQDPEKARRLCEPVVDRMPDWKSGRAMLELIRKPPVPGRFPYLSTAVCPDAPVRNWSMLPGKIYFEYMRREWNGYGTL